MAILLPLLCLLASASAIDRRFFNFTHYRPAELDQTKLAGNWRRSPPPSHDTMVGQAASYKMFDILNIVDNLPQTKRVVLESLGNASAAKKQVVLDGLANVSAAKDEIVQDIIQKKKQEIQAIVSQTNSIIQKIASKKQVLYHTIEDKKQGIVDSLSQKKDSIVAAIESTSSKKIRLIKDLVEDSQNKIQKIVENVKGIVHSAVDTKQSFLHGIVDQTKSVIASLSAKKDAAVKAIMDSTKKVVQYVIDTKTDLEQDISYKKQSIVQGIADKKINAIKAISDKTQEFISTASMVKPLLIGQIQDTLGQRRNDSVEQQIFSDQVAQPEALPIDSRSINLTQPIIASELNETVARNNPNVDGNVEATNSNNNATGSKNSHPAGLDLIELRREYQDNFKRIRVYVLKQNTSLTEPSDPLLAEEEASVTPASP